jgi:hypothetical protein
LRLVRLTWFSDFKQVLNSIREHYTKNEYFPKRIPFSTISLLQEQKLNHRNYSKQKINMVIFIQANEDDMNMSAKIQY